MRAKIRINYRKSQFPDCLFSRDFHPTNTGSGFDWAYTYYDDTYLSDLGRWLEENHHYLMGPLGPDFEQQLDVLEHVETGEFVTIPPRSGGVDDSGHGDTEHDLDTLLFLYYYEAEDLSHQEWYSRYPADHGWSNYPMDGIFYAGWDNPQDDIEFTLG